MEAFPVFTVDLIITCEKTLVIEFFKENFYDLTAKDYPNNKNSVNSFQGLYHVRRNILGGCEWLDNYKLF